MSNNSIRLAVDTLNSLPLQIAVIDSAGEVVYVNRAWIEFGTNNGLAEKHQWLGANYLDVCTAAVGEESAESAHDAIMSVLSGKRDAASVSYPCHSPDEQRWFTMRIAPLIDNPGLFVVTHDKITERVLAQQRMSDMRMPLDRAAITDSRSGLLNRRGLEDLIAREVKRSQRSESAFSVVLLDIDDFKAINDTFGHAVGDAVIQIIGKNLRGECREYDGVGRWGGDEFLILLPDTVLNDARNKAEQLQHCAAILLPDWKSTLSVNCEIIEFEPSMTIADVLEMIDSALYRTKQQIPEYDESHEFYVAAEPAARTPNTA